MANFDPNWYLQTYQDVASAGVDPLQHYLSYGMYEGRQPSSSDSPGASVGNGGGGWQRVAAELLGRQARPVVEQLSKVDPNYDWSGVIRNYIPILDAQGSGRGWEDPSRGSPSSIAAQLIQQAGNLDASARNYAGAVPQLHQQANQENAAILKAQNPPDDDGFLGLGDLGTALAIGGSIYGLGALGGLWGASGAGAAAGSAMDMGIGGIGEAMGLGAGYTSPLAGVADAAWGVNQAGGGANMAGFMQNYNPFSYTPEFNYLGDSTIGSMIPDTIGAQLPGGAWSNIIAPGAGGVAGNPFGLLDLGGNAGAIPGVNLGGNAGWLETVKNIFNSGKGITPGSGGILGNGSAGSGLGGLEGLLSSKGLGAVLGGLAGLYGGSDKPSGTTTTVEDLPEWTKPFALTGLSDMATAYGLSPYRSPVTMAGENYYGDVLAGDYLNNNPYIDAMYDKAAGKVRAGVNAMFSKGGRYGSGAHQGVLGETLGNLATDIYGQNYAKERGYQNQLAMDSDDFGTASILQPFRRGQALLGGATSVRGGSSTAPYFRNKAGEVLAGALGGSRLFS